MKEVILRSIDRVAEAHFYLRPVLVNSLKEQRITNEGQAIIGKYDNYWEYWTKSMNDRFFDMGTFVRLGTTLELGLRDYFMFRLGIERVADLKSDADYSDGIFQRIQTGTKNGAIALFEKRLNARLADQEGFHSMQECMLHRHLYAHSSGLLDQKYIDRLRLLTGIDISKDSYVKRSFPMEDCYWFEPLRRLPHFIEEMRRFFSSLGY